MKTVKALLVPLLLAAACVFILAGCAGCTEAEEALPSDGLRYRVNKDGKTASVIGIVFGTETSTDIVIADTYGGKPVTSIGDYAFSDCESLTSITIPTSVTDIGDYAFSSCKSLVSMEIPAGVTHIGFGAFSGCEALADIDIPASVADIEDYAFSGCKSLADIKLPTGITHIGLGVFFGCEALADIEIPASVTKISLGAFTDCKSLIQVENGVSYVGKWVIDCDASVGSVALRVDTVGIGDHAFSGCQSLAGIRLPAGVTHIGERAFYGCKGLTSIEIPVGITGISLDAFYYCESLTSITFSGTVDEWNAVATETSWNIGTPDYTVTCTDGVLDKSGNVTE